MDFHERLLALPAVSTRLNALTSQSVSSTFLGLTGRPDIPPLDWDYLLKIGSVLAFSEVGKCQAAALRIAHTCVSTEGTSESQRAAAGVIFDSLTNFPALQLALNKRLVPPDFQGRLPLSLRLDALNRRFSSSLPEKPGVQLTRFQQSLYDSLKSKRYVSVSAPTSAGKSFALTQFVARYILKNSNPKIIYLVPTRALIQQCETDFKGVLQGISPRPLLTSVPQLPDNWRENACLMILTQERYHWVLNNAPEDFSIDLLVVDEAQKVGDSARGILLQQVIEDTISRSPSAQILFSSPMSSNPGNLLSTFSREGHTIDSDDVTVNQNLIWVSQLPRRPLQWKVSLCLQDSLTDLGEIRLTSRAVKESMRLPFVAHALAGGAGGNLIYMNGQADAEKAALQVWGLIGATGETTDEEVLELIRLVKRVVHSDYLLGKVLSRRVAFHYGNMPLVVRTEIERLFKEGKLLYLVCTSTLLEGVNLPARSIFLRSPMRGRHTPMTEIDFWNLAGRAGRLGKEFQGNVICVDPTDDRVWTTPPPRHRTRYSIDFSLDKLLTQREDLSRFLDEGTPRKVALEKPELDQASVYLLTKYLRDKTLVSTDLLRRFEREFLLTLESKCSAILGRVEIPEAVIRRNPGISPLAQQDLLAYFRAFDREPSELLPALPESPDAAKDSYIQIISRINKHLTGATNGPWNFYLAILVVNWMRGYPLARIIADNYKYWQKQTQPKNLPAVIRDSMRDIEEFARFSFVKYSSCYVDILRLHFTQTGNTALLNEIPDLNIWLEFGASQQTQISLISLGLSRLTAIEVAELIAKDSLNRQECIAWLDETEIDTLDISPILRKELEDLKQQQLA